MTLPSTPAEALAYFAGLSPSTIKLGLERMEAALEALGHPERSFPAIHVAGTNGKGSTCAFLDSCFRAQGLNTGLFTSPHLIHVNERIARGGASISDALLGQRILEVLEHGGDPVRSLTYFELGTLLAFWHFAEEKVDVAVLETGLGGRLDATRACVPRVTAITSLSLDHQEYLGDTLAAIAKEKAGIFKAGIPAVSCAQSPEALAVLESESLRVGLALFVEGRDFSLTPQSGGLCFEGFGRRLDGLTLGLSGAHQAQNAAVAIAALHQLGGSPLAVTDRALRAGLATTSWPGRLQLLGEHPSVLVDGAHNPAGVQSLVAALDQLYPSREVQLVFGVLGEKDSESMLRQLLPRVTEIHLAPPASARALPLSRLGAQAAALAPQLAQAGKIVQHPDVPRALAAARARCPPEGLVVCAGSLVLVGEVLAAFSKGAPDAWRSAAGPLD